MVIHSAFIIYSKNYELSTQLKIQQSNESINNFWLKFLIEAQQNREGELSRYELIIMEI